MKNVLKIRFCIKDIKLKQIFDEKLYGASELGSILLQLVKNSQNKFKTCHVLNEKVHNTSDFELNTLQCVNIWIKFYISADFELPVQYLRKIAPESKFTQVTKFTSSTKRIMSPIETVALKSPPHIDLESTPWRQKNDLQAL